MSGWAPREGEDRRKDHSRARTRARRLRKAETPSERALWKVLRTMNKEQGANFRRQAQIGDRVFDFADLSRRIVIEVDGAVHALPVVAKADREKEIDAIMRGYKLLRITNDEVQREIHLVSARVSAAIARAPSPLGGRVGRGGAQNKSPSTATPYRALKADVQAGAEGADALHPSHPLPLTPAPGGGGDAE